MSSLQSFVDVETASPTAPVAEVYSAIQGEGPIVGTRQLFVRFYHCNLRCAWCDTPAALTPTGPGRVELAAGSRRFRPVENPLAPAVLLALIAPLTAFPHHSVSLTGGEPLLHHRFLKEFLPDLATHGKRIHLETAGTLTGPLEELLPWIDQISMDWKLPSSTKDADCTTQHRRFLELARDRLLAVKLVLTADTDKTEILRAAAIIAELTPAAPIILQPVTSTSATSCGSPLDNRRIHAGLGEPASCGSRRTGFLPVTPVGEARAPAPEQLLRWQSLALEIHRDVRVIPQTHVMLGQL